MRRQGNDRQFPVFRHLADGPHGLEPVHFGHHDIHQHQLDVGVGPESLNALPAVLRQRQVHLVGFEGAGEREDVAQIVVDYEDLPARQFLVHRAGGGQLIAFLLRQFRLLAMEHGHTLVQKVFRRGCDLDHPGIVPRGDRVLVGLAEGSRGVDQYAEPAVSGGVV